MRLTGFLFISAMTGALLFMRCSTLPPKTEKAIETSESLDRDINQSTATPEQKAGMKKKNAAVREVVKEQGEAITKKDSQIQSLEWYRRTFWQIVIGAGGALLGAFIFWRLRA